jgi:hypothetical protein
MNCATSLTCDLQPYPEEPHAAQKIIILFSKCIFDSVEGLEANSTLLSEGLPRTPTRSANTLKISNPNTYRPLKTSELQKS